MIIGITGHRPLLLGGYYTPNAIYNFCINKTDTILKEYKPTKIITGMAIGFDQWVAELAIKNNIPYVAAVPFKGQENCWPKQTRDKYYLLLDKASVVETISAGSFASWKMQVRNKWIVDNSDMIIAALSSKVNSGGTFNCVEYAKTLNKKIEIIDPELAGNK